ncbi:reverse transcriptase, partial [Paragonimus kellicotti]
MGLSINSTKSSCVNIVADGRRKLTMLDVKPVATSSSSTFLGVPFNWKGKLPIIVLKDLDRMFREIQAAPLKPQQRLDILRHHLLPRLGHTLILSNVHKKTLRSMDLSVRSSVKHWLRPLKDTSNAFFYASINDAGLGIPHLRSKVPLNRIDRLEKRLNSSHPVT